MEMNELRREIDAIDRELIRLFERRMAVAGEIGAYKRDRGLPILDAAREREKLEQVKSLTDEAFAPYAEELFEKLFELSRRLQEAER